MIVWCVEKTETPRIGDANIAQRLVLGTVNDMNETTP